MRKCKSEGEERGRRGREGGAASGSHADAAASRRFLVSSVSAMRLSMAVSVLLSRRRGALGRHKCVLSNIVAAHSESRETETTDRAISHRPCSAIVEASLRSIRCVACPASPCPGVADPDPPVRCTDFASTLMSPVASAATTVANMTIPVGSPNSIDDLLICSIGWLRHLAARNRDIAEEGRREGEERRNGRLDGEAERRGLSQAQSVAAGRMAEW